ncbi:MAG: geranylgeranylglyceryl/heptaprenylglyceryl phosphate synthase [Chloroherpetonaceae bacterium]|nr:geranylgeranylglyceryl/heptaprenylglyceryl phosphate synthase [Chloroherpetonaceae bacterium]MDW8436849.1 geranylgeranylglyceryl/heptaprenylglyceryl phosphate synthase [Chloroherpetonaceae bacterium]
MPLHTTLDRLLAHISEPLLEKRAGFLLLIDPDKRDEPSLLKLAEDATAFGATAILIGGSTMLSNRLDEYIRRIKSVSHLPVIIFPGSVVQVSREADAILYLSLVSGRNPEYLIGHHVIAAPLIQQLELEPISTAYLLIESGRKTAVEFMSNSSPIPRHKPEIAAAHALAAEYLGMKLVYLEAGSGADYSVPEEMISLVSKTISVPLVVGGGIRTPDDVRRKAQAGANFIVVGNAFERRHDRVYLQEMIAATMFSRKVERVSR